jgi:hypothetical protein
MKLILTADGKEYELHTNLENDKKPDLHSVVSKLQRDGYCWVSSTKVIFQNAISSVEVIPEKGDK